MAGNYPAGVTGNDPHFSMPSVEDEVFEAPYVPKGCNPWETMEQPNYPATCDGCGEEGTNWSMENHECPHDPHCKCEQCECPF